ncbi:MAG TPA: polysaccharide biosynthesis/export family protein [Pyrinomonadaceae bacterium]|jgi:protein involved in polysaccharide export with SLBB domain
MKKVLYSTALALFVSAAPVLAAQPTQAANSLSGAERGNNIAPRTAPSSGNSDKEKKDSERAKTAPGEQTEKPAPVTASATTVSNTNANVTTDAPQPKPATVTPPVTSQPPKTGPANATASPTAATSAALINIYRVGVGDVLDIRLLNSPTRNSTLYTVLPGGMIDYPLAGEPLTVTGLTPEEIASKLQSLIKIYEKPQVSVNVREYQSHTLIVTGLVNDPGLKYLRREAVPLYVIVTEAQPRTEAARAVIMRQGAPNVTVDLSDTNAMSTLVQPGDVIKLAPALPQFYFVGGAINDPGQKGFHAGLTLTQAILAAGGTTRFAGSEVKVSRTGADGKLVTTKYNLKKIEDGKIPDPVLQPGDRVEVSRSGW